MTDEPLDESATPSQKPDVDIESLSEQPSSDDYYLYSRIDGTQTIEQLCTTSGLGKQATLEGLRRLAEVGLIDIPGFEVEEDTRASDVSSAASAPDGGVPEASVVSEASEVSEASSAGEADSSPIAREASDVERVGAGRSSSSASSSSSSTTSSSAESTAGSTNTSKASSSSSDPGSGQVGIDLSHLPVPPERFDYDRELLEMDVPLSEELKRELLVLDQQVDELTHYQFFGVDRDAERGEIKKSYFKLSKRYHPDKHFRKEIGPYKSKLENVFQKITRAYRTLSNDEQREEYDRELGPRTTDAPDDSNATGMSEPSRVHMASESASSRSTGQNDSGGDKRSAAFAHLVKKAEKFRKRGDFERAAEHYRKALSLKRDLKVALQATRVLLNADAQLDQAELFARAALRIDNEHVEARMMLGRVFERQGKSERAIDQYERVLELNDDHDKARTRRKRLMRD